LIDLGTENCITEDMAQTATRCGQEVGHQLSCLCACINTGGGHFGHSL